MFSQKKNNREFDGQCMRDAPGRMRNAPGKRGRTDYSMVYCPYCEVPSICENRSYAF